MAIIKRKPTPPQQAEPANAGIMTRQEFASLVHFALDRRDPSLPWTETFRGVEYSTHLPNQGTPSLVPAPKFVDSTTSLRSPEEIAASEQARKHQRRHDQELRKRDALSSPHETGTALFSIPMARATDITAAIVYRYLQAEQSQIIRNQAHFAEWRYWTYESAQRINETSLPFLDSRQVVENAMTRLEERGFLKTETTGKFLSEAVQTGRKRDLKTWCHVYHPIDHTEPDLSFGVVTAKLHSVNEAILIGYLESMPSTADSCTDKHGHRYFRIVAKELEILLPIGEKTIRGVLKTLQDRGVIASHPDRPKFLRVQNREAVTGMEADVVAEFREWREWYIESRGGRCTRQWWKWQA